MVMGKLAAFPPGSLYLNRLVYFVSARPSVITALEAGPWERLPSCSRSSHGYPANGESGNWQSTIGPQPLIVRVTLWLAVVKCITKSTRLYCP